MCKENHLNKINLYKLDILSKLYEVHPESRVFTESEYDCYLFSAPELYLHIDSDEAVNAINKAAMLSKSFRELKCNGMINAHRTSHMSWTAELTPYGYYLLQEDFASLAIQDK